MTKTENFWRAVQPGPERAFILEAFSSEIARTLWVPVAFSLVIFSTGYLFPDTYYYGISVHFLDALVFPSSMAVFLLSKLFKRVRNGTVFNLLIWAVSGTISAIVPSVVLILASGHYVPEFSDAVPIGVVAYSLLTGISGVVLASWRISRTRMKTLKNNKNLLNSIRSELEVQLATIREDIRSNVDHELEKALTAVKKATDAKDLSDKLFAAIDEVIRPLSHKLAGLGLSALPPKSNSPLIGQIESRGRVSLARLVAPEVFVVFFAVLILPATYVTQGLSGFAIVAALALFEVAVLVAIQRRAQKFLVRRLTGLVVLGLLSAVIGFSYVFMVNEDYDASISIGFVLVTLTASGIMALVSKRLDDISNLALVNQELQAVVSVLRQEAWITKTQLAKAIHGSVQARFLAVALRIAGVPKLTDEVLAEAKRDIEASIKDVSVSMQGPTGSFAEQFHTIVEAWDGVVKLTLTTEPESVDLLNRYPVARACVLEVVGEAVANAAKHSKAPAINIELQENAFSQIVVSVWSAGKLSTQTTRKGYGSQLLDEVTSSWTLTNLKGRVYLRAVIQLAK